MLVGTSPEVGPPPPQTRPMGLQVGGATSGPPGLAPLKDVLAGAGPEGGAGLGHGELIQLCLGLLSGLSRLVEGIVGHCVGRGRVLWGALWRVAYRGRVRAMPSLSGGSLSSCSSFSVAVSSSTVLPSCNFLSVAVFSSTVLPTCGCSFVAVSSCRALLRLRASCR